MQSKLHIIVYKKHILNFISLVMILGVTFFCLASKNQITLGLEGGQEIRFSDQNLYEKIVAELETRGIAYEKSDNLVLTIAGDAIGSIDQLSLNNSNIVDLSGLENFTSLNELNISNNKIVSLNKISGLTNLRKISIYGNQIKDISSLSGLTNLINLNASNNYIQDLSVVGNLTHLQHLDLHHNLIRQTSGIENLTELVELDLYDNLIENLSGVVNLPALTVLRLGENKSGAGNIANLNNINTLTNLRELNFAQNKNSEILNYLSGLHNLEILNLEGNNATDISALSRLTSLKELILYENQIANITPLFTLTNLEVLVLGNNKISTISGVVTNGQIVWPNIKSLRINENNFNKNSEVEFLCNMSNNRELELDYENITDVSLLPHVDDDGTFYVTYEDFGARADGVYDDFIAIRNAQNFGKRKKVQVRGTVGKTYHIFGFYDKYINLETNTDWQNATIIIHDENIDEMAARNRYLFTISNTVYGDRLTISNPDWTVNKQTKNIPELAAALSSLSDEKGYDQYFVKIENSEKKQFIRYKANNHMSNGNNQQDIFLIDKDGNVLNDIIWNFDKITSVTVFPILDSTLTFENGNFVTNSLESMSESNNRGYGKWDTYRRSIQLYTAFNVNISNVNHTISSDQVSGSYNGFFFSDMAANLQLVNCKLFARKYISRYTYDMYLTNAANVLFDNVIINDINNLNRWFAIVSAYSKDVEYANSQLNVIDAHEGIYNLTIRNSEIGARGIEVLGFGDLKIIDSTINSNELMHLKEDYGSSWDGTIYVSNSTLRYKGKYGLALVSFSTEPDGDAVHDYGYDLVYPNVIIENLTIDNQDNLDRSDLWIIPDWNRATNPYISDTYFDNNIFINGISFINNNHFDNPGMMLFVNNIDKLKGNYVITDLKMQNAEGDFTHAFNVGESMSSNSDVTLTINKPNSFANRLTVYRNDEVVVDNVEINNTYSNTFKEDGDYKIQLTSIYDGYNRDGIKEYEFTIDKSSNPVTPPDDDDDDNDVIPEPREDEDYIPKVPNTGVSSIGTTVSSTFTIVLVIIVCRILIRFSHKKVDFDSIK